MVHHVTMTARVRTLAIIAVLLAGCVDGDEVFAEGDASSDTGDPAEFDDSDGLDLRPPPSQCQDYPGSLGCPCVPECMTNLVCDAGRCTPCAGGCGP
jgi:hypothetical protein